MYSFKKSPECVKAGTHKECQLTCQLTPGCSKFSYFTKYFKSSNYVGNESRREALDCCLIDTRSTDITLTKKQDVISGLKRCSVGKAELKAELKAEMISNAYGNEVKVKDLFSGKMIKCKSNGPLITDLLFSRIPLIDIPNEIESIL